MGGEAVLGKSDQAKAAGCFVAGTLVHTKEGLRPIEQIKVGDYVLSKPESGEGELSYQRVTRTYEYEDREIYFAAWIAVDRENPTGKKIDLGAMEKGFVVVTGAHPFWVHRILTRDPETLEQTVKPINAWMSLEEINLLERSKLDQYGGYDGFVGIDVLLSDGRSASLWYREPILQHTRMQDVGVGFSDGAWDITGTAIEFTSNGPIATLDSRNFYEQVSLEEDDLVDFEDYPSDSLVHRSMGAFPMLRKVFNIEVEGTHTYFVGELGAWVADMMIESRKY